MKNTVFTSKLTGLLLIMGTTLLGFNLCACSQPISTAPAAPATTPVSPIRINQLGYYPQAPKFAVVISTPDSSSGSPLFYLVTAGTASSSPITKTATGTSTRAATGDTVYSGHLGPLTRSANSSLSTRIADFSAFEKEGLYEITVPGKKNSYPFRIGRQVAAELVRASLKGYYYQRSAMALEPLYAGQWSRPAGHPDTMVLIHSSAASDLRPAGAIIQAPGGWYDAGDYNKYIVNSGITMGTLLAAYEDFPDYYDTLHTNIPPIAAAAKGPASSHFGTKDIAGTNPASSHSGTIPVSGAAPASGSAPAPAGTTRGLASAARSITAPAIPDLLNEALYNLRWMLTMQDPADGGVYHKCTNAAFDGMVMPGVTRKPRYVVQKGTAATLDFAAVMAQAARILREFPAQLPGLSDSCLQAATRAWTWAVNHPSLSYDQEEMNKSFEPKITTGAYGDRDFKDEWYWAAVELMVTIPSGQYQKIVEERISDSAGLPSWANVHMLGDYTLLRNRHRLPKDWQPAVSKIRTHLLKMADEYSAHENSNAFHTVMGGSPRDFVWGSNAVAANQGILLINAWLQTKDRKYIDLAAGNLDYLLGRNATGYCFVTGMGSYSPMHPHHRPSVSDGIQLPVPGLLAGGPNPGRQDHQKYNFTEPETAYLDQDQAYASNEIAINWNAPLVYLAGALEALQVPIGYSAGTK